MLSGTAYVAVGALADKYGWEYFDKLKANGIRVEEGNSAIQNKLLTGEYAAAMILEENILKLAEISESEKNFDENVVINGENVSFGLCVSLGWYSIVLASFMSQIGKIAAITNKKNAAILLDLLSGDNVFNMRNMKIVENIIDNSILSEFQLDAFKNNELETLGFGYGQKNGNTKDLKNDFEYVIVDWIVQSFHSLLLYKKNNLNKNSEEYELSLLARYLIHTNRFKINDAFQLI